MAPTLVRSLVTIFASAFSLSVFSVSAQPEQPIHFEEFLARRFTDPTWKAQTFCATDTSIVARRVLESYGSMFSAADSVTLPAVCIHEGDGPVTRYQKLLNIERVEMSAPISLQKTAAQALRASIDEAALRQFRITPLDGSIAGARTYGDTMMLWNSRIFPALNYWTKRGRLTPADLDGFIRLEPPGRVERVLEWEQRGIFFSTDRSRSVLTSTAPPGASQHLALIALDIVEYANPEVKAILNRHGWYQTIIDDPPHFTFLGHAETELPLRGLKQVYKGGHAFWVPNLSPRVTD